MMIFKIILFFIVTYVCVFIITMATTTLVKVYFNYKKYLEQKEIKLKFRPQQKIKQEKKLNKKWNSTLGVWEIED